MPIDFTRHPKTTQTDTPPAAGSASPGISLSKVTLTKSTSSVSLAKEASRGRLHVNLNWDARPEQPQKQGGFLKRLAGAAQPSLDLDLGCLYELSDGTAGVVQALGATFGSMDAPPFILLDGDDRSGANTGGENLFVNLEHAAQIRRVLVFACIYEGAAAFDQAQGVVTITPVSGPPIEVRLDGGAGTARMCAIAMVTNSGGELSVRREVQYINGSQQDLDKAYGFGLRWQAGRK